MFETFKDKDPDNLLKMATLAKNAGNYNEAISLLKAAYKIISKGDIMYGPQTFLRLPLYLQQAKRPEGVLRSSRSVKLKAESLLKQ